MQKCYFKGKKVDESEFIVSKISDPDNLMSVDIDIDVGKALGVNEKQQ